MKDYIKERSKAFGAGLGAALTVTLLRQFEQAFGVDFSADVEGYIVAGVTGAGAYIVTYWSPANKPRP